jgi:hypothetical protein
MTDFDFAAAFTPAFFFAAAFASIFLFTDAITPVFVFTAAFASAFGSTLDFGAEQARKAKSISMRRKIFRFMISGSLQDRGKGI